MTTSGKWIGPLRACDSHGENLVFSVVRATCITAMAATGTVAGVVVCSVAWHSAGSVATTAITVIGGISGAATGVGAAAIRSIKRCGRELQTRCRNTIADVEASVTAVTELPHPAAADAAKVAATRLTPACIGDPAPGGWLRECRGTGTPTDSGAACRLGDRPHNGTVLGVRQSL